MRNYNGCVPDPIDDNSKAREGTSLSDVINRELQRAAESPRLAEWLEQTARTKPIRTTRTAARIIRELRDAR